MNNITRFLLQPVACALILSGLTLAQSKPAADLIVTNAKIWTVDKSQPTAQAVAVLGDRIVAVGSIADVDAWRGLHTQVIDGGGKLLLPGFNDAHVHFVSGGMQLDEVQLKDVTSPEEFARRIGERAVWACYATLPIVGSPASARPHLGTHTGYAPTASAGYNYAYIAAHK